MARYDLTKLLEPVSSSCFFDEYFRRDLLLIGGTPYKFTELLPWTALNDILRHHRLDHPQLRLVKDGKPVPVESYSRGDSRSNGVIHRIVAPELTKQLRDGATLIINNIDYVHEPITALASQLERAFGFNVQVNLYAGWHSSHGFDLHWDDHDVFILQVSGKKHWSVYGQTTKHPLVRSPEEGKPTGEPKWQGHLSAGDLLYIPRGWWHVAVPCEEPTLHLTVGLQTRTGIDLLRWLEMQLLNREEMRMDLPHFEDTRRQTAFLTMFQEITATALSDKGLLRAYYQDTKLKTEPRPALSLPWGAMTEVLPPSTGHSISLAGIGSMEMRQNLDANSVEIGFRGRIFTFNDAVMPLIEFLRARDSIGLDAFYATFEEEFGQEELTVFLSDLLKEGMLTICETSEAANTASEHPAQKAGNAA